MNVSNASSSQKRVGWKPVRLPFRKEAFRTEHLSFRSSISMFSFVFDTANEIYCFCRAKFTWLLWEITFSAACFSLGLSYEHSHIGESFQIRSDVYDNIHVGLTENPAATEVWCTTNGKKNRAISTAFFVLGVWKEPWKCSKSTPELWFCGLWALQNTVEITSCLDTASSTSWNCWSFATK